MAETIRCPQAERARQAALQEQARRRIGFVSIGEAAARVLVDLKIKEAANDNEGPQGDTRGVQD